MELRNSRFKLPILPEPRQRKRRITNEVSTPKPTTPRAKRLASRLERLEASRDLPSPIQRKRMERRMAEIRKRRDEIIVEEEDSVFGHGSFVSARTFHRQLLAAVIKGDEEGVEELMRDPRMPMDAATTQYSFSDHRTPLVEAYATANSSLIMALLKARAYKRGVGVDDRLLEPLSWYANFGTLFLPTVPSDDLLALKKFTASEKLQEPLLTQLVRRNVPFSIIEKFRAVSLYLDWVDADFESELNVILKKAHDAIGDDGEFYDYGAAAVEALRFGHCILALNLARNEELFPELTQEIIIDTPTSKEPFDSNAMMYKRSKTTPYFLPIHAAAAKGRIDVLEWYYTQYPNALNHLDGDNWTVLHYAAVSEDSRALKWMMAKGVQMTMRNKQGQTPLHVAVRAGRIEHVKVLCSSLEALDRLCLHSDHLFLEFRSSLNWKTNEGFSALHLAAGSGNLEIVEALCRHPFIDVSCRDKEGITPIMISASRGHLACVEFLSKRNTEQVDELKRDDLMHAAINGQTNVVAFLLKSTTMSHDSTDTCHNSALHYACAYGWLPIVKMLVEVDSSMLAQENRKGLTPVVCAYRNGHFGIVQWLVASGYSQFVSEDPSSKENLMEEIKNWMENCP